jgi:predicted site-specific integrase-resolvase
MLVTPREAASELFVSYGMIAYWIRKGRLAKHPTSGKHYLVDLDEARRASRWNALDGLPDNLITPNQAADMIGVVPRQISYYTKMGYVKKHYVLGNSKRYLVDVNEVLAQPERIKQMLSSEERKEHLRKVASRQKRDSRNRYFVSTNPK